MTGRKRASGAVRRRVLDALRAAVDERGPGCFASQRAAAKALAAVLPDSASTIRRALALPQSDIESAAIDAAIRPAASATADDAHRVLAAGFGSEPVGEPLVSHPVSQGNHGEPPRITDPSSPQVAHGEPVVSHEGASRAREPRRPTSPAPLRPPQGGPSSADPSDPAGPFVFRLEGPPIPSDLVEYPLRFRRSLYAAECRMCRCGLDEGQAFILVPYGSGPARPHCMDCAEPGLAFAQAEWVLSGRPVPPPPKSRKPKSDPNPQPEE